MPIAPDVGNYTIGKGKIYIGEWSGTTPPSVWTDLGNAPSVEIEHAVEKLPHYASMSSFKLKDKNIVLQKDYTVNFTLDEISAANLQLFIQATREGDTLHALEASETEYALKFISDNPAGPNRTYEFWKATLSPNGPMSLIGEEWMQMAYVAEGLADTANHSSSPYYDVTFTTTTTTTTTTSSTTTTTTA